MIQNLKGFISDAAEKAITLRRQFHAWPELGREEVRTAGLVCEALKEMGIVPERPCDRLPTAVVGMLSCRTGMLEEEKVKTILLRAEMDALPITEGVNVDFSSKKKGMMHACGHDVHMAVMLGTATVMSKIKSLIDIDVKLIFQPDEEGDGGAGLLIEDGILKRAGKDKNADLVLGFHVKPELTAGTIGLKYGKVHAASVMFQIKVKGKKAHGAKPQEGRDAVTAAAYIITNSQTIIARNLDPVHSGVISFGRIYGGEAGNIIADEVTIEGILRGEDEEMCRSLKERLMGVAQGTAAALGMEVEVAFQEGYPALVNDDFIINQVWRALREYDQVYAPDKASGYIKVKEVGDYSMTVDDFACYIEELPGAYLFLGSGYEGRENPGIHTGNFEPDESCIETGIAALVAAVLHMAKEEVVV